ncbi:MAG: RdgB/HAM1 family non-canonical purine NTP pyrophosphatase [Miltoncostaeaceae bacterium]
MRVVLATGNPGKAADFEALWPGLDVAGAPAGFAPEENGSTMLQNAWIKAAALRRSIGGDEVVIADDSGLVVAALGGRPGVFSARYAGVDATDQDNCRRLLQEMDGADDRRAAFVCVLVALAPEDHMYVAAGSCAGAIAPAMRGEGGFGYDPLFIPEGDHRAMAELSRQEKAAISHRGRAARRLGAVMGFAAA